MRKRKSSPDWHTTAGPLRSEVCEFKHGVLGVSGLWTTGSNIYSLTLWMNIHHSLQGGLSFQWQALRKVLAHSKGLVNTTFFHLLCISEVDRKLLWFLSASVIWMLVGTLRLCIWKRKELQKHVFILPSLIWCMNVAAFIYLGPMGGGPSACSLLLQSPLHLSSTQLQCHCLQKFFPLPDRARIRFFFKVRPAFSHKCNGLYFVVVTCVSFRDTQTFTGIWTLSLSSWQIVGI